MQLTRTALFLVLFTTVCLIASCLPPNIHNINKKIDFSNKNSFLFGQPKANPYYGEIELGIDTSLAGEQQNSRQFTLVKDENGFNTQSFIKLPEVVYTKVIKLGNQETLINESFDVPDTKKKYVITVMKQKIDDNIEIKINNIPQVNQSDFEKTKYFMIKPMLLEANNNITVKINGKAGNAMVIAIVESSKADIVREKIQNIKWQEITKHSKNHNQIFFPNELTSIGNLKPFEGDILDPNNPDMSLSISTANDTTAVFETGYIAVTLREPAQSNLTTLLSRLNATTRSVDNYDGRTIAIIKINYETTDLTRLYENIKELNTFSQAPIQTAQFSSVNSAKTIANFIDVLVNHSDLISNAGLLNHLPENAASVSPDNNGNIVTDESQTNSSVTYYRNTNNYDDTFINRSTSTYSESTPKKSTDSWWLKDTNITKAWKYTVGEGTKVGVFDTEFYSSNRDPNDSFPLNKILNIKDLNIQSGIFKSKLESLSCPNFNSSDDAAFLDGCSKSRVQDNNKLGHGFWISSLIASDIDDNYGNSGISPRSKLFLFTYERNSRFDDNKKLPKLSGISDLVISLYNHKQDIINSRLDVINISSGGFLSLYDYQQSRNINNNPTCLDNRLMYKPDFFSSGLYLCGTLAIQTAVDIFDLSNIRKFSDGTTNPGYKPLQKSIIIVSGAGNDNKEISTSKNKFFFPGSFTNVINVGAYEIEHGRKIRADFGNDRKIADDIKYLSSNYGAVDLWAPGDNIAVMLENDTKWANVGGTSFAAPIVSGVIALMKSIKPDLDIMEAREILQDTGTVFDDQSTFKQSGTAKYINAEAAVIKTLQLAGKSPSESIYKVLQGRYDTTTMTLRQARDSDYFYGQPVLKPDNVKLYPQYSGKDVFVSGWFRDDSKTIFDVLQMRELPVQLKESEPGSFVPYNGKQVPVVQPGSTVSLKPGDNFAIGIQDINTIGLENIRIYIGEGNEVTLKNIVDDYLIAGVPGYLNQGTYDILIKMVVGSAELEPPFTIQEAIEVILANITSDDILSQPSNNITFNQGTSEQFTVSSDKFIVPGQTVQANPGDIVAVGLKPGVNLNNIRISVGGEILPLKGIVENYIAFGIPDDIPPGVESAIISVANTNESITLQQAIEIISGVIKTSLIAFTSNRSGSGDIYIMREDGSEQKQLTYSNGASYNPNISKDGKKVVYKYSGIGLNVITSDGADITTITSDPDDNNAKWSPDGTKILFTRNYKELYVINSDGNNIRKVYTSGPEEGIDMAVWSPDGTKISFSKINMNTYISNITVINADGNNVRQLTGFDSYGTSWFPDSSRLAFTVFSEDFSSTDIYTTDSNLTNPVRFTFNKNYVVPVISPDGTKMAYEYYNIDGTPARIGVMNIDGSNDKTVFREYEIETWCTLYGWTPDSKKVLLESNRTSSPGTPSSNAYEIYTANVTNFLVNRLTDNDTFDGNPSISSTVNIPVDNGGSDGGGGDDGGGGIVVHSLKNNNDFYKNHHKKFKGIMKRTK